VRKGSHCEIESQGWNPKGSQSLIYSLNRKLWLQPRLIMTVQF